MVSKYLQTLAACLLHHNESFSIYGHEIQGMWCVGVQTLELLKGE